jgi:hypothetical protein
MNDLGAKGQPIAIIGGTGKEGKGLAYRWARAGYQIIIGSRQIEKADQAAAEILKLMDSKDGISGMENSEAARKGNIIVLTVPYAVHKEILNIIKPHIQGKILIDVTVPFIAPPITKVQMPPSGSAAQEAKNLLGDEVRVVSAFQNISYENLFSQEQVDCDVLVCGDKKESREIVIKLVHDAGLVGWDAGPLENSAVVEGLTSILIGINKNYGSRSAGIKITGVAGKAK